MRLSAANLTGKEYYAEGMVLREHGDVTGLDIDYDTPLMCVIEET